MKKAFLKRILCMAVVIGVVLCACGKTVPSQAIQLVELPATSQPPRAASLTGKTATEVVAMMDKGYNIGNSFDATGGNRTNLTSQETSWGNPVISRELIEGIKKAGFNTVRIPITWYIHVSKQDGYKIDQEWLDHIKEIVDYAYEEDLFIIINMHHENWLNVSNLGENYEEIGEELSAIWKQVAEYFADYDQHLIFEGMNEPRAAGTSYEWTGTAKEYDAVNYLDQLFVDTVRDNGKGFNGERLLMIPGYAASSSEGIMKAIELPLRDGVTASNLVVSVHCYNPYEFCLSDSQTSFNPKSTADTLGITSTFKAIKKLFLDNGIPAIIGECGCTNTKNNNESRLLWFDFFGAQAREYGVPAIVWDNGSRGTSGGECHSYIDRKTGEAISQDLIDAFILGYIPGPKVLESQTITFEPKKIDGETVVETPFEKGFTPRELSMQMKINHTPDAEAGFALKISKDLKEQTAVYDMAGYVGKDVIVSGYLYSQDGTEVSYGVVSEDSRSGKLAVGENWKKFALRFLVTEGDGVYLTGEAGKTFYLDDFSITIVDEKTDVEKLLDMSENEAAEEGGNASGDTSDSPETDVKGDTADAEQNGDTSGSGNNGDNTDNASTDAEPSTGESTADDSFTGWPWLVGGLAGILAIFGVTFGLKNRKKK